jgi:hypothetical protein
MKLLTLFVSVMLLSSTIMVVEGSYGLRYELGGKAQPFGGDGSHGTHSARLDYDQKTRYIRIDLLEALPLDQLDDFYMNIKPLTQCGIVYFELWFDGDGDSKYSSQSDRDLKLYTDRKSLFDLGLEINDWKEFNGLDLEYGESRSKGPKFSLNEWINRAENLNLIRLYVRFETSSKKFPSEGAIWLFDYFAINGMIASFEPNEGPTEKAGKPSRISRGGKITYTITYGNDLLVPITNLVIVEDYSPRMTLLSADPPPDPGTNNVWTIGTLLPGEYGKIVLVMKMEKQNFVADLEGQVSGNGFVSVRRRFTTEMAPHTIVNQVRISCDQFERRGRVATPVRAVVGTTLSFSEHGSGRYESEELSSYRSSRMKMERSFDAVQAPSALNLSGRVLEFNSSWHASHVCVDEKRGSIIRERYLYAERLNLTGQAEVRSTRLKLGSEANLTGMAIYEIESHTKERDAAIANVFKGSYSLKTGSDVYK